MCFNSNDASKEIERQQQQRQFLIQQGLGQVNRAYAGFNPQFYDRQKAAILAAQLPQVGRQFVQQRNQLGYGLADQGLLRSSAGAQLGGALQEELAQQERNVFNQATQSVQGLQRDVSASKGNIISQLQQSADPTVAAQRAVESATQFSAPSLIQPLGDLFSNFSNIYLARQIGQRAVSTQPQTNQSRVPSALGSSPSYGVK